MPNPFGWYSDFALDQVGRMREIRKRLYNLSGLDDVHVHQARMCGSVEC